MGGKSSKKKDGEEEGGKKEDKPDASADPGKVRSAPCAQLLSVVT